MKQIALIQNAPTVTKVGRFIKSVNTPDPFYNGAAVVYNNKIYILGGTRRNHDFKIYSWNGKQWTEEYSDTNERYYLAAVVYNNRIHILGGDISGIITDHYSWGVNDNSLTQESTLPYSFAKGSAVIYNNKIHIIGSSESGNEKKHYSWNGTTWINESTLPQEFYDGCAIVYNNKIHIIGGNSNYFSHYSWNGTSWIQEASPIKGCLSVWGAVYNNEIHILGGPHGNAHQVFDGNSWREEVSIPEQPYYHGSAVVFNDFLETLGGTGANQINYIFGYFVV